MPTAKFRIRSFHVILLLIFLLSIASPVIAAKVKKKSGEVVEGTIKGTLVLFEANSQGSPSAWAVEGKDVVAIDENGLQAVPGKWLFVLGMKVGNPSDILLGVREWKDRKFKPKQVMVIDLPGGGQASGMRDPKILEMMGDPSRGKLLGEFRVEKKNVTVVSSLDIQTEKGIVTVPVNDIVEASK